MTQNRSAAVMQQRHEPNDSLDYFGTPPWATRALMQYVIGPSAIFYDQCALDPACGRGHMLRPLSEYFRVVMGSDVQDLGFGEVADFLIDPPDFDADWIITNPPFKQAERFIHAAFERARVGVAMFVRSAFVESEGRYQRLFSVNKPTIRATFPERVILYKGDPPDPDIPIPHIVKGKEVIKKPSSATAYEWLVWEKPVFGTRVGGCRQVWIPPCRIELTRPGDYEVSGC